MFTSKSKKDADAYDRMLDTAEQINELIESFGLDISEKTREELSIKLSQNKEVLNQLFKGATLGSVLEAMDKSADGENTNVSN